MWFAFTLALFGMLLMVMTSTKFVTQGTAGIVERMGKYVKTVGPGVHFIAPIFSKMIRISLKERVEHFEPQDIITKEGLVVKIDAFLLFRIIDAKKAIYDVESYIIALDAITMATLRDVVGGMTLSHTLESREVINSKLRAVLDEHTSRFGIKVTSVEIKAIDPPGDFTKAMEEEKRAEITKIANITISEGEKQAEINRAEGGKQAAITTAEGQSEAMKRKALGEKEAAILRAEGRSTAYVSLFKALSESNISEEAIAVRYLEALEKVADGNATTLILPNEASGILGSMAAIVKTIGATSGETLAKEVTDHFLGSNSGEDPPSDPGK